METELGILKNLIKEKKVDEAIAIINTPTFSEIYGKGISGNLVKSLQSMNFDEALTLVSAIDGFLVSAKRNLTVRHDPHFGTSLLPTDW